MSDCILDIGGFCAVHPRGQCYDGKKRPTTVVTIELSKEAADRLLALNLDSIAGFKVLSIERVQDDE